ncbi:MAG: NUDIX domain-containing protein [Pseudomonadales bacterium]
MTRATFPVVVHVLFVRDAELFLMRRANTGFMDGYFALPGGHQHAGESVTEAALRECEEETGIRPEALSPRLVMPYRSGRHQGLNFLFEAERWQGEPRIAEPALFDAAGWYPLDALPERSAAWIADALALRARGQWFAEFAWD